MSKMKDLFTEIEEKALEVLLENLEDILYSNFDMSDESLTTEKVTTDYGYDYDTFEIVKEVVKDLSKGLYNTIEEIEYTACVVYDDIRADIYNATSHLLATCF